MDKITILAPAKVNLALDVVGVLPNGYHALDMVMQAVTLYERITIEKAACISLTLPGSDLPGDEHNIAWKAAKAFLECTKLSTGAAITVEKHTPVQAGMGGGSADAAGVLAGMNLLYADSLPRPLTENELCTLGVKLGADVPFALAGGTCRVQGIGEKIEHLPPLPDCWLVVVKPAYGISTPAAFKAFDSVENPVHPDVAGMAAALKKGDLGGVCALAGNALEAVEGAADNEKLKAALKSGGAIAALMTGSGAAVFGIFAEREAAERTAKSLKAEYEQVYVVQPCATGPRQE